MSKIIIAYLNTASGAVVFVYVWESVMIDGVVSSARNTDTINSAIFMLKTKHHFHKPFPSLTERGFLQILVYFVPAKCRSLSDFFCVLGKLAFICSTNHIFARYNRIGVFSKCVNNSCPCSHYLAKEYSLIIVDLFFSFLQEVLLIQVLAILYFLLFCVAEIMANRPFLCFFLTFGFLVL